MTLEQVLADAVEQANGAVETALADDKSRGKLIKIDRNGSKHFEGYIDCDKCGGSGTYVWGAIINGCPQYAGVCFKCGGTGKLWRKWIERTPEYQAKLDARREARHKAEAEKHAKEQAERQAYYEAETARIEAEKARKEAEEKARKAISQYVGKVGERITVKATYISTARFEVDSYRGFGKDTMHVHTFKDANGNKLIWKTAASLGTWLENGEWLSHEYGEPVDITGTVKEHKEYKDEKQTALTRCKMKWKGATA